jgi:hypothetical protein
MQRVFEQQMLLVDLRLQLSAARRAVSASRKLIAASRALRVGAVMRSRVR